MKVTPLIDMPMVKMHKWYNVLESIATCYIIEGEGGVKTCVLKDKFITDEHYKITEDELHYIETDIQLTKQLLNNIYGLNTRNLNLKGIEGFKLKLKIMKGQKLTDIEKLILFSLIDEEESHCNLKL